VDGIDTDKIMVEEHAYGKIDTRLNIFDMNMIWVYS